jgi:hypothetical protein
MSFVYHLYVMRLLFVYYSYGMVCMVRYGTAEALGVIRVDLVREGVHSRQTVSRQAALSKYACVGGGGQRDP